MRHHRSWHFQSSRPTRSRCAHRGWAARSSPDGIRQLLTSHFDLRTLVSRKLSSSEAQRDLIAVLEITEPPRGVMSQALSVRYFRNIFNDLITVASSLMTCPLMPISRLCVSTLPTPGTCGPNGLRWASRPPFNPSGPQARLPIPPSIRRDALKARVRRSALETLGVLLLSIFAESTSNNFSRVTDDILCVSLCCLQANDFKAVAGVFFFGFLTKSGAPQIFFGRRRRKTKKRPARLSLDALCYTSTISWNLKLARAKSWSAEFF